VLHRAGWRLSVAAATDFLGPGYVGRAPAGGDWRATPLAEDRVLLEDVNPAAWFDELTLEEALAGESMPRQL
jgi:hypothetical protein